MSRVLSDAPNVRTWGFKQQLGKLPERVRKTADAAYRMFLEDPAHPALRLHELQDTKKGRHRKGSKSVSVTARYRALFVEDGATNVWYWIGSHEDYNNLTGKK